MNTQADVDEIGRLDRTACDEDFRDVDHHSLIINGQLGFNPPLLQKLACIDDELLRVDEHFRAHIHRSDIYDDRVAEW